MINYIGPKTNDEDFENNTTLEYSAFDRSYKIKVDLFSNDRTKVDELNSIMISVISKIFEVDGAKYEDDLYRKIKLAEELMKDYGKNS